MIRRRQHYEEQCAELERTKADLDRVRRRWPLVRSAAESLDKQRDINGFADAIRTAMGVER